MGFLGVWVFGWFFVLHLCFQSVETAPKLDSEKNGVCISIYSVFKGCACRRGGDHIKQKKNIYIYIYPHLYRHALHNNLVQKVRVSCSAAVARRLDLMGFPQTKAVGLPER